MQNQMGCRAQAKKTIGQFVLGACFAKRLLIPKRKMIIEPIYHPVPISLPSASVATPVNVCQIQPPTFKNCKSCKIIKYLYLSDLSALPFMPRAYRLIASKRHGSWMITVSAQMPIKMPYRPGDPIASPYRWPDDANTDAYKRLGDSLTYDQAQRWLSDRLGDPAGKQALDMLMFVAPTQ
jgi:hypothetical protein